MSIIQAVISSDSNTAIIDMPSKNIKYKTFAYRMMTLHKMEPILTNFIENSFIYSLIRFNTASLSEYALYIGGYTNAASWTGSTSYNTTGYAIAYDKNLLETSINNLSYGQYAASAVLNNNVIVTGGCSKQGDTFAYVNRLTSSLVKSSLSSLSAARYNMSGTSSDQYAIFSGGVNNTSTYASIDVYNSSFTKVSNTQTLSNGRQNCESFYFSDHFVVLPGNSNAGSPPSIFNIDILSSDIVRTNTIPLSENKMCTSSALLPNYLVIAGGLIVGSIISAMVEVLNSSFVRTFTSINTANYDLVPGRFDNKVLFAGGYNNSSLTNTIEIFDNNLTRTDSSEKLTHGRRRDYCAETFTYVGDYMLALTGTNVNEIEKTRKISIDVFTLS